MSEIQIRFEEIKIHQKRRIFEDYPVSPKPWRKITEAVCLAVGFKITDMIFSLVLIDSFSSFVASKDLFKVTFLVDQVDLPIFSQFSNLHAIILISTKC